MDFGVERKETGFKLRLRLSQIDVTMGCKFRTDIRIIGQASETLVGDRWSNAVEPPKGTWMRAYVIVSTISHLSSFCLYLILMLCHMHKHLLLFTRTRIQPRVRI